MNPFSREAVRAIGESLWNACRHALLRSKSPLLCVTPNSDGGLFRQRDELSVSKAAFPLRLSTRRPLTLGCRFFTALSVFSVSAGGKAVSLPMKCNLGWGREICCVNVKVGRNQVSHASVQWESKLIFIENIRSLKFSWRTNSVLKLPE